MKETENNKVKLLKEFLNLLSVMSLVSRSLFHSHCFCPCVLMERVTIGATSLLTQENETYASMYVFVAAKTRPEERADGEKDKREFAV